MENLKRARAQTVRQEVQVRGQESQAESENSDRDAHISHRDNNSPKSFSPISYDLLCTLSESMIQNNALF